MKSHWRKSLRGKAARNVYSFPTSWGWLSIDFSGSSAEMVWYFGWGLLVFFLDLPPSIVVFGLDG